MIGKTSAPPFWQSGWLWLALALGTLLPSLFVTILPFNDLPNHVGRHYVFLNAAHDPFLQRFYAIHWSLIGNLGVDLPVRAIGPMLGAELATHVVVALIPPLLIAAIYCLSRALYGQVQPAALASAPMALNWPLITGFTNFSLSAAIALLVLALWIKLRPLAFLWRFLIFTPLGFMTWVAHTAGWGLLGLGVAAFELAHATQQRPRWKAVLLSPLQTLPFAMMIVFTVLWRSGTSTGSGTYWDADITRSKVVSLASLFREHFLIWDAASTGIAGALILFLFFAAGRRLMRTGACIAGAYLVFFAICPQWVFNSGFADRRILTYAYIFVPLAIGVAPGLLDNPRRRRLLTIGALACLAFFTARIGVATFVWHRASVALERRLSLIDVVPPHSRIFGLVVEGCTAGWNRVGYPDHIQQYALLRRDSVINGMFQNSGLNQVAARMARPEGFDPNMLAVVHDERCPVGYIRETLQSAMRKMPRDMFDYVWIIGEQPLRPFDTSGMRPVAALDDDRLYRVMH